MNISLSPRRSTDWDAYVWRSRDATFYHLSAWPEIMERYFGHQTFYLAARESGELRGVFPLVSLKSRLAA